MTRTCYWFFLLVSHITLAQEKAYSDSLRNQLAILPQDTNRVTTYVSLGKTFSKTNEDVFKSYVDSALNLAEKLSYAKGIIESNVALGNFYLQKSEFDSAIDCYTSALEVALENELTNEIQLQYDNIGTVYYYQGNFNQTLEYFKKRLSACEDLGDPSCISAAANNVGVVLISIGNYQEAIQYALKSLAMDEQTNNIKGIMSSQMSLGNIHFYLENYDQSLEYFEKVAETSRKLDNPQVEAYAFNNIASIYFQQKQFEQAGIYYEKSLELERVHGTPQGIGLKLNNLGSVYFELNQLTKAKDYFLQALTIREELNDLYGISSTSNNLGKLYLEKGRFNLSLNQYQKGLDYAEQSGSLDAKKIALEGLANAYKGLDNYREALANHEAFMAIKDSILNEENTKQIAELEARYQNEKNAQEIELLSQQQELDKLRIAEQEAVVNRRSVQRNILIGSVLALVIIVMLIRRNYQTRLKSEERINHKSREFEALRSSFFANISHEFRTPLTLISAPLTDLLQTYSENKTTATNLQLIRDNSNRLLHLINQLLELSKLEVGKLTLQVTKGDIIQWLKIITTSFESYAITREVNYVIDLPDSPLEAYFDQEKVERMVTNLLSNAFKFTQKGGKISVATSSSPTALTIHVENEGDQIPPEALDKLFDRFYQYQSRKNTGGTGIGLALVKELAELHHGAVAVSSDEKTTTFSITIPLDDTKYEQDERAPLKTDLEEAPLPVERSTEKESATHDEESSRILIVEDNAELRAYMSEQLDQSFQIHQASNGSEGLESALSEIPELIITDVMMPEMDGIEMLEALRADPKTNHIPIIMLTAKAEKESRLEGIAKGADHYLDKPFEMEELKIRIKSILDQREKVRAHYHKEFLTDSNEPLASVDDRFVEKVMEVLESQYNNHEFTVEQFARELAMSRVQLQRKMKAVIGYSPSEFMRIYRLKKAHHFLKSKVGSVSEIAYSVGFANLSYFTKSFKEIYKVNPSGVLNE